MLPIQISEDIKDLLDALVMQKAFITRPSFDRDGAVLKVVSKMLRAVTQYPTGGVAESWVIHVNPVFQRNLYEVNSVFYGDERLATALKMYGIPFKCDNERIVTSDNVFQVADHRRGEVPYNIHVEHCRTTLKRYSPDLLKSSISIEWEAILQTYSPKQLTVLDLKQAEFAHKFISELQRIGNPTLGLGDLYIVDTHTFKQRLRSLEEFGGEVQRLARQTSEEFETVEFELKEQVL